MITKRSWQVLLILIGFAFSGVAIAALDGANQNQSQQKRVTVKTISPINTNSNGDATSSFSGISSDAAAAGLADTVLIGAVDTEELDGNKKRVKITWHTMEKQKLGQPYRQALETPLTSSVVVNADQIPPQTNMIATGDLDILVDSFNTLLEKESNGQTAEDSEQNQEQTSGGGSLSPGSTGRLDTGSAGDSALPESEMTGEVIPEDYTESEACPNRADIPGLRLYKQAKIITRSGENGETVSVGECQDVGEPITLTKEYGGECSVIPDIENRVAYRGYRVTGIVDGMKQIIQDCKTDFDSTYEIKATIQNCGVTNDFVNGETIQQERLFYLDDDGEHQVRSCADSDIKYAQFTTSASCEPIIDMPNGIVYPQQRTAYKNNLGETMPISDCAIPESSGGIAVQDEVCSPQYEHDFINGQSYVVKRQFYSMDNEKRYLTSCGRTTESYPHLQFTDNCGVINDDEKLLSKIMAVTAIDTPEGQIEISPCAVVDTTSYVYDGYESRQYEIYNSTAEIKIISTTTTWATSWRWLDGTEFIPNATLNQRETHAFLGARGLTFQNNKWTKITTPRVRKVAWKTYIRLDGSKFSKWDLNTQDTRTAKLK